MKFNWGHGITLVYTIFAVGMLGAVITAARNHNPGLVQKDYYELDMHYQARMEQKQNTARLSTLPKFTYDRASNALAIAFPPEAVAESGKVKAFKPADAVGEIVATLPAGASAQVPLKDNKGGYYRIELDWTAQGKSYYYDNVLVVAPQ